jgi:post-segregation antitoxin (ccd killing protein)
LGKKKITTMRIDEDLIKKAHELGLNVTKICENALKEMIARIERPISQKEPKDYPEEAIGGAARIRTGVPRAQVSEPRPC